jgi:PHD/YefM family antitoxin component YafN of YafNO toxin-antitoxin module
MEVLQLHEPQFIKNPTGEDFVVIPMGDYESLLETIEDMSDVAEAERILEEEDPSEWITIEELIAEMGWKYDEV